MAWESADLKPMSKKLELVKLTLCGPSDVAKEIDIAKKVIDDWNRLNAEARGLTVKHQHWLSDTYPDASERGQGNVNKLIIDEAQILVAVFWWRIGTPTGEAESGTVEEIRRGIQLGRKVLVYFSDLEPIPTNADKQQVDKLWSFRQELKAKSSCWSFQSRDKFREQFTNHLAFALNAFKPKVPRKSPKAPTKITQTMRDGIQNTGDGNTFNQYQHPPVIKNVMERRAGSVTAEEEHQIGLWIEELAEGTLGKTRSDAFAKWGSRFLEKFKVAKREALQSAEMSDVEKWYRLQRAIQKSGLKTKAPDQWRKSRIAAIKRAMKEKEKVNETYYPELSDRLNMKKPFTSLTKLTKTDLQRVYDMVLRDNRGS